MPENESFPAYSQSAESILSQLTSRISGLSTQEVQERLSRFGENKLTAKKTISPFKIFFEQFQNTLTIILLCSAVLILFIYFFGEHDQTDLIEAGLIFGITFMIAILGFIQEYKAEKAVESLRKMLAFTAKVRRNDKEEEIDVTQLVPGDIVILEEGMRTPSDIRLLEVYQLRTSESALTGESTPVTKITDVLSGDKQISDQTNMVFSGTNIVSGRGIGVVIFTGNQTEIGKIATSVSETVEDETPLQKRLEEIGKKIGFLVMGICGIVFVFIVFFAGEFQHLPLLEKIIQSFIASVSLAVAAIPEGLPAVVTISLALGTQRMLKKHVLVKKLNSVETLGSTDVICSDKTGTLTKGEMTVSEIYFDHQAYIVSGSGYDITGTFSKDEKEINPETLRLLLETAAECTNANLGEDGHNLGDPTEVALLVSAAKAGIKKKADRVYEIPFTSERKMMSVVVKKDTEYMVFTKGAPEMVLPHCQKAFTKDKEVAITETEQTNSTSVVHTMSTKALRTLGFGYKKVSEAGFQQMLKKPELFEEELTFLGVMGMIDPARPEVKDHIANCHASGIRVMMITGDHKETAKAVAATIGIPGEGITGAELDALTDQEWEQTVKTINIYARVNPNTKMKIVDYLKKADHVVAMTGDGVNDAPALKRADIGIAMGITGTDVAKEASDVILLDDHFASIVKAIEEGRGIYQNIKKFVHYLLACNLAEVLAVFFAIFLFRDVPLSATMLLWINVVTDGLPAIALGLDPTSPDILKASPKAFQQSIINRKLWIEMTIIGLLISFAVLFIYYRNLPEGIIEARSAAFASIVIFEMVTLFLIRNMYKTPFFTNRWLMLAVFTTCFLQIVIMSVPFLARLFGISQIDLSDWLLILLSSVGIWIGFLSIQRLLMWRQPLKGKR